MSFVSEVGSASAAASMAAAVTAASATPHPTKRAKLAQDTIEIDLVALDEEEAVRRGRAGLVRHVIRVLSRLSGDEVGIIFGHLCNVLDPRVALNFSSGCLGLWEPTQGLRQQLKADHAVAVALCLKAGVQSCKELREAKLLDCQRKALSAADLTTLSTLGAVLPALEKLYLSGSAAGPDGVLQLAAGLDAGSLPAVTTLAIVNMHVGDAGASALAAALGRGALPQLRALFLCHAAISDAGLVALAPALRQLPALETLNLSDNPLGDEGIAALLVVVAPPPPPPPPASAPSSPTGGLTQLTELFLEGTQVADAGCAALASALSSGALPPLERLELKGIPASAAATADVSETLANKRWALAKLELLERMTGDQYDELLDEGMQHGSTEDWPRAARAYREATVLRPDAPVAYYNLGLVLRHMGHVVEAAQRCLEAYERAPEGTEGWAQATAAVFQMLTQEECVEVAKPEWWNDGGLKALSARVAKAAPDDDSANSMRGLVLLGESGGTWEAGPRSAAELREAATHFERGAELCHVEEQTTQRTCLANWCRNQADTMQMALCG